MLQHSSGIGLGDQLGFEVQPGGQVPISMTGTCIAVDATMLTATVRIDRAVKGQVRRVVASDDALGGFDTHFSALGQGHFLIPAVILGYRTIRREAIVRVAGRTATAQGS
ncbi:hypothetical protein D3C84_815980 [compost metagenome]